MKLVAFKENEPYKVTEFPFDDMYVDDTFIKVGYRDDGTWLGILVAEGDLAHDVSFESISEFTDLQTNTPVTKAGIISRLFTTDQESKLVRDAVDGRNLIDFYAYDTFIQSIEGVSAPEYEVNRKSEYPPIEEFIDGWVKDDIDQMNEYKAKCLAVKAKYPKPE